MVNQFNTLWRPRSVLMIRLLTAALLFASFSVVADDLKTFSNGQVIEADDFNHNFQKLEQDIAEIPTCTTDQVIVYRGGAWVCSSPELVTAVVSSVQGEASCSSGKRVTGGGCQTIGGSCFVQSSRPSPGLTAYFCETGGDPGCTIQYVFAICQ